MIPASGELDVMLASMREFWRRMATDAAGAFLHQGDGFLASVMPGVPERSIANAVVYEHGRGPELLAARDQLERIYSEAGVKAWTVWVNPSDPETAAGLAGAGHRLDGSPRAMALDLRSFEPDRAVTAGLDCFEGLELERLAALNDRAYGHDPGTFAAIFGSFSDGSYRNYGVRVDGELAGGLMIFDADTDALVCWVATEEAMRGRGVARCLMEVAMEAARERGQLTSTLQATRAGAPVYARVGFEDLGPFGMWELRRTA